VHTISPEQQPLEPDLIRAQRDIKWAEHLVFVYPTWWGRTRPCSRVFSIASRRRGLPSNTSTLTNGTNF
jgi:hypothetical protein